MVDPFDRAFAALEPRERNSLRAIAIARSYDRGEVFFHQGDDPGALHVIMRGRVKVSAVTDDGREALFSLAGPGDLVGEISALAGRQRTATVRALEPPRPPLPQAPRRATRRPAASHQRPGDRRVAADGQRRQAAGDHATCAPPAKSPADRCSPRPNGLQHLERADPRPSEPLSGPLPPRRTLAAATACRKSLPSSPNQPLTDTESRVLSPSAPHDRPSATNNTPTPA